MLYRSLTRQAKPLLHPRDHDQDPIQPKTARQQAGPAATHPAHKTAQTAKTRNRSRPIRKRWVATTSISTGIQIATITSGIELNKAAANGNIDPNASVAHRNGLSKRATRIAYGYISEYPERIKRSKTASVADAAAMFDTSDACMKKNAALATGRKKNVSSALRSDFVAAMWSRLPPAEGRAQSSK